MGGVVRNISYREYEVFKRINGFDPNYLSHYIYLPLIARRINDYRFTKLFEHKSLLGHLSSDYINFPKCFVRCINSEYYTDDMQQISKEQAIELCSENEIIIIKDSVDSSGGKSIEKVDFSSMKNQGSIRKLQKIFDTRKNDFVIQECIRQHPVMAQFNETSVNTFRLTTLYLNGKFSLCSICLRIGKSGSHTDNMASGGIIIPVSNDGSLGEKGYDSLLNEYTSQNGVQFKDIKIDKIPQIISMIEQAHIHDMSLCKLIGWDVCISSDGEPVVIEVNSSQPGLFGEQVCCHGPIFGKRTTEVIRYCLSKSFSY